MALETVPTALLNTSGEHCFQACAGMALAHFGRLGKLTLQDIVHATEEPGEEVTPIARVFEWMQGFGVSVEYIEELNEDDATFMNPLQDIGVTLTQRRPTFDMALDLLNRGNAVITQVSYTPDNGQEDFELDHAVFLNQHARGKSVLVLDPDGMEYGLDDLSPVWGRYPNLISIEA